MIRKPVNDFYNGKFTRVNVNIDSIERSAGHPGEYTVKLSQRLLNVKGVRIASAELPNTIYAVTDNSRGVTIQGMTNSITFSPFPDIGNYTPAIWGYGNKNLGYSGSFVDVDPLTSESLTVYYKWLYNPATMKITFYSSIPLALSCAHDDFARFHGMVKGQIYQTAVAEKGSPHYQVSYADVTPFHLQYSFLQAFEGRSIFPPNLPISEKFLYNAVTFPNAINLNPTPYVYLQIKEFTPFYDRYMVAAKTDEGGNANLAKIPLTSPLGSFVYYLTFRRIDTVEFFNSHDQAYDIDTLTIKWLDAYNNVVNFNGVNHSFILEVLSG